MRVRRIQRSLLALFAVAIGTAGCAAGAGGGGSSGGGPNRISAEEMATVQQLDAYQAIQRLRAQWLRARGGSTPQVVLDNNPQMGGLDALRSIRVADLAEMRYMSASDATTRFGTNFDGGAIILQTKR